MKPITPDDDRELALRVLRDIATSEKETASNRLEALRLLLTARQAETSGRYAE